MFFSSPIMSHALKDFVCTKLFHSIFFYYTSWSFSICMKQSQKKIGVNGWRKGNGNCYSSSERTSCSLKLRSEIRSWVGKWKYKIWDKEPQSLFKPEMLYCAVVLRNINTFIPSWNLLCFRWRLRNDWILRRSWSCLIFFFVVFSLHFTTIIRCEKLHRHRFCMVI